MREIADLPPSLEEIKRDYQRTLASFEEHLDRNPFFHAQVDEGVCVYAFHAPAIPEFGALEGDETLTAVIYEIAKEDRITYIYTLRHCGEQMGDATHPPQRYFFVTHFTDDDLEWYDMEAAERIRAALQDAADNNRFSAEEAWLWVSNKNPGHAVREARLAEERSEERMRRVWDSLATLMVEDIESNILRGGR